MSLLSPDGPWKMPGSHVLEARKESEDSANPADIQDHIFLGLLRDDE